MSVVLSVKDLTFSYENAPRQVLNGVTFELPCGSYTALIGNNGSGKSTTAKIIAGLLLPKSGTVKIADGAKVGIVFQSPQDQIISSVVERDTAFYPECVANLEKSEIDECVEKCLGETKMTAFAKRKSLFLSLGQTQKVALCGMLATNPDILILDEATSMLDEASRNEIFDFLDDFHKSGKTILHITHDKKAIARAENVIVMKNGVIAKKSGVIEKNSVFHDHSKTTTHYSLPTTHYVKLSVSHLSFSYGDNLVLDDVSFSLFSGTLTALTGVSGSGKSTLLEILAGLKSASNGDVFSKNGERPVLCLQDADKALFETFAADDVAFGAKNSGVTGKKLLENVKNAMNAVDLPFDEFASRQTACLSGGEKRRLAVASIIALPGEIFLFDEPTSDLDADAKEKVLLLLRNLADSGKTVLWTTHDKSETEIADFHIELKNKKISTIHSKCEAGEFSDSDGDSDSDRKMKAILPLEAASLIDKFEKFLKAENGEDKSEAQKHRLPRRFQRLAMTDTHRLTNFPPALKIVLFLALFSASVSVQPLFLCGAFLATSVFYAIFFRCGGKKMVLSMIKIIPFLFLFFAFEMIFAPHFEGDTVFLPLKYFFVTKEKILYCVRVLLHTESALCCIFGFFSSTQESDIVNGAKTLLFPLKLLHIPIRYIIVLLEIIFRFIPLLATEAICIIKTQLVRGGLKNAKGFFQKIRAIIPLIVPLIIRTIKRAEILADAMTARGFK